jgi:hypothetical protein
VVAVVMLMGSITVMIAHARTIARTLTVVCMIARARSAATVAIT